LLTASVEDPEDYSKRSPITYVKNVKTPMFIPGDTDLRTPETRVRSSSLGAASPHYGRLETVVAFASERQVAKEA